MTTIYGEIDAAIAQAKHHAVAPLTWDPVGHLLSRFAFGPTAAERAWVAENGVDAWFANQIDLANQYPGYSALSPTLDEVTPLITLTPLELQEWVIAQGTTYTVAAMDQLSQATLALQAYSPAQLLETLVDFFGNHLNVANHDGDVWASRCSYDLQVIRSNVMGSFPDMLLSSARHPAMLLYLNLAQSSKTAVNENYGRELLELHTVGLHYSESDVQNVARLLTGRTVSGTEKTTYSYNPRMHATGAVQVLGFSHDNANPTDGEAGGDAMLEYLALHPYTASHLAQKLCVRYVSDAPAASLVSEVANAYSSSEGSIISAVSTILRSSDFWESRGSKVRRPTENLVASIRVLGLQPADWRTVLTDLQRKTQSLGNGPYDCMTPNGYADVASAWRSSGTLMTNWQNHEAWADNWPLGFADFVPSALFPRVPRTSAEAIDLLTNRLTGMSFSAVHKSALQTFVGEPANVPYLGSRTSKSLVALVSIILDGPHHALR